jgi:uncharacterized protein YceK
VLPGTPPVFARPPFGKLTVPTRPYSAQLGRVLGWGAIRSVLSGCRSVDEHRQPDSTHARHAAEIAARGRMAWQRRHGYGRRFLVETAISRIKRINGGRLTSRTFGAQQNEVAIHVKIANRNMMLARPQSERVR